MNPKIINLSQYQTEQIAKIAKNENENNSTIIRNAIKKHIKNYLQEHEENKTIQTKELQTHNKKISEKISEIKNSEQRQELIEYLEKSTQYLQKMSLTDEVYEKFETEQKQITTAKGEETIIIYKL